MKNLWMTLPPLLADNFGMIEALRHTDGCGVIDDSGEFRLGPSRHGGPDTRVVVSGVENSDVIGGTREKVLSAAREAVERYRPSFVLFSAGPCGAMIGTDLGELADAFAQESGLPCGVSELTGQKTYDAGISKTLEGMAKLLAKPVPVEKGSVNLIGATELDWSGDDLSGVRRWAEEQGLRVIAQPGMETDAAAVGRMAAAEWNIVTTVSGLAMARYLEETFGTPYVALAPFGSAGCRALRERRAPEPADGGRLTTLIVAEQLTGNAVRAALEQLRPGETAQVCTFFQLDKRCARPGDKKLKGEDDAGAVLGEFERVIADPLLRELAPAGVKWIDLPHRALHTYGSCTPLSLLGEACDRWLENSL